MTLKRKFQAVTIMALIYIGGVLSLGALGVLALIVNAVASLCNWEASIDLLKQNCNSQELTNFVKAYMIFN